MTSTTRTRVRVRRKVVRESGAGDAATPPDNPSEISPPPVAEVTSLLRLAETARMPLEAFRSHPLQHAALIARIESAEPRTGMRKPRHVVFVTPQLPHPCELDLWNAAAGRLGAQATVLVAKGEEGRFHQFVDACQRYRVPLHLQCSALDTIPENRTFLAGLDAWLKDATLVVALGESSLATYQVVKARRSLQNRLAVWQLSPRPPEAQHGARTSQGLPLPELVRLKSIRKEVLKTCDALLSFDKDASTWAYLENVNAQRIRRITRGIDLKRFSVEINATQRIELRSSLGLPETDFIFLQAGPLEIETGALDSVYAFKSLLQSNPVFVNTTKLVFCGTGSAGADVRQAVVDLQLDDHVFFLNPNDPGTREIIGNQMVNLLAISDALIHNPISAVNGSPSRHLDCSFDVLCALASGLTLVSNGNGWVGEWLSRFYRTFAASNIHSQAKLMRESLEKQDRLGNIKKSVRTAFENELALDKAAAELAGVFQSLLDTQVRVNTENSAALLATIDELVKAKKYLDAIQHISKAFEEQSLTASQRATLFRYIGDCFTKLGDLESGHQNYLQALEIDPYCHKSLIGLGTVALQRNDFNAAVPQFQKAVTLAPGDDLASLGLSLAFDGMGEHIQALQWAHRACQLNVENTAAIFNLVRISHELEQFEAAESVLTRYVGLHPYDVNMTFTLGGVVFKLGKMDAATQLMETILMLDPTNARAQGLLQQIQRRCELRKQA